MCVALLMQHYGTGKVDEMLHQHGRAELGRWVRRYITMEGQSKRASMCCIVDATLETGKVDEMLHQHGRAELGGRRDVSSPWKGGAKERACVASLMQH